MASGQEMTPLEMATTWELWAEIKKRHPSGMLFIFGPSRTVPGRAEQIGWNLDWFGDTIALVGGLITMVVPMLQKDVQGSIIGGPGHGADT